MGEAIDEVAALARAGIDGVLAWEPVTGPLPPSAELPAALSEAGEELGPALAAVEQLAREAGASRADLLDAFGASLADAQELSDARDAALAGPRATARVLAWLPVLGLVLGTAIGAQPLQAIARGGVAGGAALTGAILMALGWAWTRRLLAGAARDDAGPLVAVHLLAAALDAGLTLPAALVAAGQFGDGPVERCFAVVGRQLMFGQPWDQAWADRGGPDVAPSSAGGVRRRPRSAGGRDEELLAACRRALTLAWDSGVAATPLLKGMIARWRRRAKRDGAVAAARLGVTLMLPLGLCYLPAFVCVGLVPVVVSLAGGLIGPL
jgi:tight adherence protein B